jgi:hypothetical protein
VEVRINQDKNIDISKIPTITVREAHANGLRTHRNRPGAVQIPKIVKIYLNGEIGQCSEVKQYSVRNILNDVDIMFIWGYFKRNIRNVSQRRKIWLAY